MRKYILLLFNIAILLMTTGCSDCGFGPDGPTHSVTVYIPYSNVTREGSDTPDADAVDIQGKEGVITDLWFFAYPIGKGEAVVRRIDIDQLSSDNNYRVFYCDLKQGEYKIYLTANIPGISIYTTEDQLKAKMLDFSNGNLPVQGELPLLYEYKNNEDNNKLEVSPNTSATITANMIFVCSKVKFSLRFDNTDTGFSKNSFGSNRLKITSIMVKDIVTKGGLFDGHGNDGTQEKMLTVNDFDFNKDQWSYTDSLYLPENYNKVKNTYLEIKGTELTSKGNETTITHTYKLLLGGEAGNKSGGNLERGTFYDMIARIKGKGKMDMDINMSVFKWDLMDVYADFSQTSLWVSRTGKSDYSNFDHDNKTGQQILVTSQYNDSIGYKTNAKEVTVECVNKIGKKPLVLATVQSGQILFTVNPDIEIDKYNGNTTGTAVVAIHANNLVKYIDVQYNVTPFLNVTPLEVEIHTEEGKQSTYAVLYETNLGGIKIDKESLTSANSANKDKVTITYPTGTSSKGKIMLQSDGNATNTWTSSFTVSPSDSKYDDLKKQVKVTVIPSLNDYRIHFIALNDSRDGANKEHNNTGKPTDNKWPNYNIYLYTQYGMTDKDKNDIPNTVWYFFDTNGLDSGKNYWPGVKMKVDPEDNEWQLYELSKDQSGVCKIEGTKKNPTTGETLIMFNSGDNDQRYPYDMEPGVQLFDFKNREGWFVYDPTSNLHEFFESKPDIHLVTFYMYYPKTMDTIDNWYIKTGSTSLYGKQGNEDNVGFSTQVDPDGHAGWKLTSLSFWCVKGRENKYVIVKKENGQEYGMLFGGKSFKSHTGYYKDGSWYEGTPPTTTNTKQKRRTRR